MNDHSLSWQLQPESPTPLHAQLGRAIQDKIARGDWKPGEQIASERELMRLAGVSRATVRQTITSLTQQGVLERQHGRGTFVARPRYEQQLNPVYSFSDQIRGLGLRLDDHIVTRELIPAAADLVDLLRIAAGEPLVHLERLRLLEGVPLMLNMSYMPYSRFPGLLEDDVTPSLYRLLSQKYGLVLTRSVDVLESIPAPGGVAAQLGVSRGTPLMYVIRTAFTEGDVPVHVGLSYIRGDMCRFRIDLRTQLELIPPASLRSGD